jgi:CsoR family transcriptional regulator, copper-sensing transcriptional repressor
MPGYEMHKSDYIARLRRIEGQIRGLQRLIEDDTYCIDVLNQVSAATKALQSVAMGLVDEHLRHCVADAAAGGDPQHKEHMLAEATKAIERLVKS